MDYGVRMAESALEAGGIATETIVVDNCQQYWMGHWQGKGTSTNK
jgi:hypothetical protein